MVGVVRINVDLVFCTLFWFFIVPPEIEKKQDIYKFSFLYRGEALIALEVFLFAPLVRNH
ncbi:hypothetical protein COV18_01485 [Candidatus Woesearchaeota archaeon CG10_big_fil_rev_8_21_14_0_10_37_12]|nr:MAG: hypothetical protein COV18_01485 [Candidatus Woesearchaeota archaeon CG10_big_fil_rev_8_21_14_0_10_37_12]